MDVLRVSGGESLRPGEIESGYLWTGRGWIVAPGAGGSSESVNQLRRAVNAAPRGDGWSGRSVAVLPRRMSSGPLPALAVLAALLLVVLVLTYVNLGIV